jgi:hypothetical protein
MPSKKTPAKTVNKSDFIRAQPSSLSTAEVIAKGRAEGLKFGSSLVYMVRRRSSGKAKKDGAKAATPATKPTASPASKPTPVSKSAFIRAQPATLSAAEVVAKAKAEGLSIHIDHVYKVRGPMGRRAKGGQKTTSAETSAAPMTSPPSKTATAKPTKPTAASTNPPKSKADFVRAHATLSPKEVVAKAKAEGVKFDVAYVYRVRAMDKTARKKKRTAAKRTTSTAPAVNSTGASVTLPAESSSAENLLRAIAAELGLGRAVEILAGERARVMAVMAG